MYLYGASGHGKVIKEILESTGQKVDGFIDDNTDIQELSGVPVKHTTDSEDEVIVSIGDNDTRKNIVKDLSCKFSAPAIHAQAIISPSATLGEGTVVMAGAIINAESHVGKHCIINTRASVDHECEIGNFVHVSPGATLCGNVTVGEGAWIGAGTTVIQGVRIGRWAVIGAGSVVTKNIPDGYLAVGNRCKAIKLIHQEHLK